MYLWVWEYSFDMIMIMLMWVKLRIYLGIYLVGVFFLDKVIIGS